MSEVVRYELDDDTAVAFEIDPPDGFRPAGAAEVVGRVREAVDPAVRAAREVLEELREAAPDEVEVKFGIKVGGKANWLVAKATTDANFEIKMTWRSNRTPVPPTAEEEKAEPESPAADGGEGASEGPRERTSD